MLLKHISLSLLSEKHILGPLHFLKNTFFYSNALLRNEMRILPFEISFGICPHPSQLLPALEHFCQKSPGEKEISPGFDLRFKLLQRLKLKTIPLHWSISKNSCKAAMQYHVKVFLIQPYNLKRSISALLVKASSWVLTITKIGTK